jgi:hypothetical protein
MKKLSFLAYGIMVLACGKIFCSEQLIDRTVLVGKKAIADLQELPLSETYDTCDRTNTLIGKAILRSELPMVDAECIKARGSSVDILARFPDQRIQIQKLLCETEAGMKELVEYASGARLYGEIANPFYLPEWRYFFPSLFTYLNDTPRVLDSGVALSAAWKGVVLLNALALSGIFTEFLVSRFVGGDFSFSMALKSGPGTLIMRHSPFRSVHDDALLTPASIARFNGISYGDKVDLLSAIYYQRGVGISVDPRNRTRKSKAVAALISGIHTGWTDYVQLAALKNSISSLNNIWKKIGTVHVPLCKVARVVSAAHEIASQLESCNEGNLSKKIYDALAHLEAESPRLYELLLTETFAGESDVYSRGRVLVAHRWLLKEWQSFKKLCTVLGELDAVASWGTIVAEESGLWSIPQISDQLVFHGLRHPVLSLSADAGQDIVGAPLIVITGPNGSGKTTALEAVSLAVVLHQTWGIVPAHQACMPIYNTIATSLRALGSVASGKSRFMAQLDQLETILDLIKKADERIFVATDEPLSGTVQETAGKHIVEWCRKCLNYGTATIMLATHCAEPAKIENAVLLQPEVIEHAPGDFQRTFKLIPGVALWWFTDIPRRDRFIVWLAHLEGRI